MSRKVSLVLFAMAILVIAGCGSTKKETTPKAAVKGTVTLNGKALPDGEIAFALGAGVPERMDIKDGSFSGEAPVGKCRVEISAFKLGPPLSTDPDKKPTKMNILGDKYGPSSTLTAEVPSGGTSDLKFDLTAK